jgi:ribosomal protein S2
MSDIWLGGLLTNFQTVQKSIKRLKELEAMQTDGATVAQAIIRHIRARAKR